jgi:FtsH-binding integral membrane protein
MDLLHSLLVLLHLVGFAALFGGAFVQLKASPRVVNTAMLHGAYTQVVTGLLLVGLAEMGDGPVNHAKIAVKTLVLVAILVLILTNRRREAVPNGAFWGIFGLTLANAAVAVFW